MKKSFKYGVLFMLLLAMGIAGSIVVLGWQVQDMPANSTAKQMPLRDVMESQAQ